MSQSLIEKWVIAQIKPNSCDIAVRNLERQGFKTFLPKIKTTIKKENRFINKSIFVFPGYIFIGFNPKNLNWIKINSTYGISKVLVFNQKPSQISYDLILALKNRYKENIDLTLKECFQKGDSIKFNTGPFVDIIARIENLDSKNRIWVLLDVMGGYRKLKLKQNELSKYLNV